MSIATEIAALAANKAAIKSAIEAKNPATAPTDALAQWPTAIASIPSGGGGGSAPDNDVIFIDYDGTILYSYTAAEAAALTALPELPTHEGLTCQGWNYTLAQLLDTVSDTGAAVVGATYKTSDGKTRILVEIGGRGFTEYQICFSQTEANGVTVDWGDGSATETVAGTGQVTPTHTYAPAAYPARYMISLAVASGSLSFAANITGRSESQSTSNPINGWLATVLEAYIGDGVTSVGNYTFQNCMNLRYVTLPEGITLGTNTFYSCYSLRAAVIPSGVAMTSSSVFQYCRSMSAISIPGDAQSIGYASMNYCQALKKVAFPHSLTSLNGNSLRGGGYNEIYIPNAVTTFGDSTLGELSCLSVLRLPTALTTIGPSSLYNAQALQCLVFPADISSIAGSAFSGCYALRTFDFRAATAVPTLSNVSAFTNTPTDKKIIVPNALYSSWVAASNWSDFAANIVSASQYQGA